MRLRMPRAGPCGWRSWWHRRLRRIDREWMWPTLRKACGPEDDEEAALLALRVWAAFTQDRGQEHWRCPCADTDDPR